MKCPACGAENKDGQQWCDFCKEPFKPKEKAGVPPKKKPGPGEQGYDPPLMPPQFYAKVPKVDVSAEAIHAVGSISDADRAEKVAKGIPAEFSHLESGKKIKPVSPAVRYLPLIVIIITIAAGLAAMAGYTVLKSGELPYLSHLLPGDAPDPRDRR